MSDKLFSLSIPAGTNRPSRIIDNLKILGLLARDFPNHRRDFGGVDVNREFLFHKLSAVCRKLGRGFFVLEEQAQSFIPFIWRARRESHLMLIKYFFGNSDR